MSAAELGMSQAAEEVAADFVDPQHDLTSLQQEAPSEQHFWTAAQQPLLSAQHFIPFSQHPSFFSAVQQAPFSVQHANFAEQQSFVVPAVVATRAPIATSEPVKNFANIVISCDLSLCGNRCLRHPRRVS